MADAAEPEQPTTNENGRTHFIDVDVDGGPGGNSPRTRRRRERSPGSARPAARVGSAGPFPKSPGKVDLITKRFGSLTLLRPAPDREPAPPRDGAGPPRRIQSAQGPRRRHGDVGEANWDRTFWKAGGLTFGRDHDVSYGPAFWLRSDGDDGSSGEGEPPSRGGSPGHGRLQSPWGGRRIGWAHSSGTGPDGRPQTADAAADGDVADPAAPPAAETPAEQAKRLLIENAPAALDKAAAVVGTAEEDEAAAETEVRQRLAVLRLMHTRLQATLADRERALRKQTQAADHAAMERSVAVAEVERLKGVSLLAAQSNTKLRVDLDTTRRAVSKSLANAHRLQDELTREKSARSKTEAAAATAMADAKLAKEALASATKRLEAELLTIKDKSGNIISQSASAREEAIRLAAELEAVSTAAAAERSALERKVRVLTENNGMLERILQISKGTGAEERAKLEATIAELQAQQMTLEVRFQLAEAARKEAVANVSSPLRAQIAMLTEQLHVELSKDKPAPEEINRRIEADLRVRIALAEEETRQALSLHDALRLENRGLYDLVELYKVEPLASTLGKKGFLKTMEGIKNAADEIERQRVAAEKKAVADAAEATKKASEAAFVARLQVAMRAEHEAYGAKLAATQAQLDKASARAALLEAAARKAADALEISRAASAAAAAAAQEAAAIAAAGPASPAPSPAAKVEPFAVSKPSAVAGPLAAAELVAAEPVLLAGIPADSAPVTAPADAASLSYIGAVAMPAEAAAEVVPAADFVEPAAESEAVATLASEAIDRPTRAKASEAVPTEDTTPVAEAMPSCDDVAATALPDAAADVPAADAPIRPAGAAPATPVELAPVPASAVSEAAAVPPAAAVAPLVESALAATDEAAAALRAALGELAAPASVAATEEPPPTSAPEMATGPGSQSELAIEGSKAGESLKGVKDKGSAKSVTAEESSKGVKPAVGAVGGAAENAMREFERRMRELETKLSRQLDTARADITSARAELSLARGEAAALRYAMAESEAAFAQERRELQAAALDRQNTTSSADGRGRMATSGRGRAGSVTVAGLGSGT